MKLACGFLASTSFTWISWIIDLKRGDRSVHVFTNSIALSKFFTYSPYILRNGANFCKISLILGFVSLNKKASKYCNGHLTSTCIHTTSQYLFYFSHSCQLFEFVFRLILPDFKNYIKNSKERTPPYLKKVFEAVLCEDHRFP